MDICTALLCNIHGDRICRDTIPARRFVIIRGRDVCSSRFAQSLSIVDPFDDSSDWWRYPFVAGIGRMSYCYFITYNFVGGITLVLLFTLSGYFFGNIPFVRENFEFVILAIILISVVPIFIEWWKARRESKQIKAEA